MVWAHWGRFLQREGERDTDPVCKKGHQGAGRVLSVVYEWRGQKCSHSVVLWRARNGSGGEGGFTTGWPRIGREDALRGTDLLPEVGFCGKDSVGQMEQPEGGHWNPSSRELCRELEGREGHWQVESNERMCDERGKQYRLRRLRENNQRAGRDLRNYSTPFSCFINDV